MKNYIAQITIASMALVAAVNVNATVNMQLLDAGSLDQTGFSANLSGNQIIQSDDEIGIYSFTVFAGSNPSIGGSSPTSPGANGILNTMCISPAGVLEYGYNSAYTYTANSSPNVAASSYPANAYAKDGLANAQWLFNNLSGKIVNNTLGQSGGQAAEGAAMALAVYTALYNSTGFNTVNSGGPFQIGGLSGSALSDYNADLALLANAGISSLPGGYVLIPDNDAQGGPSGQEMILMSAANPNGLAAVPEASSLISGLLILLPFGAGLMRVISKKTA